MPPQTCGDRWADYSGRVQVAAVNCSSHRWQTADLSPALRVSEPGRPKRSFSGNRQALPSVSSKLGGQRVLSRNATCCAIACGNGDIAGCSSLNRAAVVTIAPIVMDNSPTNRGGILEVMCANPVSVSAANDERC